jgi:hypothetical protein
MRLSNNTQAPSDAELDMMREMIESFLDADNSDLCFIWRRWLANQINDDA